MNKKSFSASITATILGMLLTTSANANLISNGSFEEATGTALGGSGGWNYYLASNVPGWNGDNIELWINRTPNAYEGDYHAELNAHGQNSGAWSISQTFSTILGYSYDVFFAYSARSGSTSSSNEVFNVSVDGQSWNISDHVTGSWKTFSQSFTATGNSATLTFTSVVPFSGTLGNFIDDVRVTVPEPGALALLGLGLLGPGVARKRNKSA